MGIKCLIVGIWQPINHCLAVIMHSLVIEI